MFLLLILLFFAKVTDTKWDRMSSGDEKGRNATHFLLNLTAELIHDTDQKISKMDAFRYGSLRSAAYEIGYLGYKIQEEYRKMTDIYNTSYTFREILYPTEQLLFLHDVEHLYWSIEHLCNMQHEVERKYRIFKDPSDDYQQAETTPADVLFEPGQRPYKGKTYVPGQHLNVVTQTKRRRTKKTKDEKILEKMLDRIHSTKKKSTRWWWPLEYGWEIDEYW